MSVIKRQRRSIPSGQPDIAQQLLAYLVEHPHAQDTLEGITQWWLLEQEIKRWTAEVQSALADLVARGLVMEREGDDGRVHYRINQHKSEEISALLEERQERRKREPGRKKTGGRKGGQR